MPLGNYAFTMQLICNNIAYLYGKGKKSIGVESLLASKTIDKIRYFPLRAFLSHTRFHCRHRLLFILSNRDNYSFTTKIWN